MSVEYKLRMVDDLPKEKFGDYRDSITELVKINKGQMSFDEYKYLHDVIMYKGGCNLLVFGLGRDSGLWMHANQEGSTIFIEDNQEWINEIDDLAKKSNVYADIRKVEYTDVGYDAERLLDEYKSGKNNLSLDLPQDIRDTKWDIIIVDGPIGYGFDVQCRMKSIYESYNLSEASTNSTEVFVHDCERDIEDMYTKYFFKDYQFVKEFNDGKHGILRHFKKNK